MLGLFFFANFTRSFIEKEDYTMEENIKWTKSYFESLNERLRAVGMPEFVIDNGFVYKDELHKLLGVGVRLEEEEIS